MAKQPASRPGERGGEAHACGRPSAVERPGRRGGAVGQAPTARDRESVLALQRTAGNRAVERQLAATSTFGRAVEDGTAQQAVAALPIMRNVVKLSDRGPGYGAIEVTTQAIDPADQNPALKSEYPGMTKKGERPVEVKGVVKPTKAVRGKNASPLSFTSTMDDKEVALALRGFDRGHVIAISAGGDNVPANVVPQHPKANIAGDWNSTEKAAVKKAKELGAKGEFLELTVKLDYPAPSKKDDVRIPKSFSIASNVVGLVDPNAKVRNTGAYTDEQAREKARTREMRHDAYTSTRSSYKQFAKNPRHVAKDVEVKNITKHFTKIGPYDEPTLKAELQKLDALELVELLRVYLTDSAQRKAWGINHLPRDPEDRKQVAEDLNLKVDDLLKGLDRPIKERMFREFAYYHQRQKIETDPANLRPGQRLGVIDALEKAGALEGLLGVLPPKELRFYGALEGLILIKDSGVASGAEFTQAQKEHVYEYNIRKNGALLSDAPNDRYPLLKETGKLSAPEIDHIVPKSQGGRNAFSNARVVSKWLNNRHERNVKAEDKLTTFNSNTAYSPAADPKTHKRGPGRYEAQKKLREDLRASRRIFDLAKGELREELELAGRWRPREPQDKKGKYDLNKQEYGLRNHKEYQTLKTEYKQYVDKRRASAVDGVFQPPRLIIAHQQHQDALKQNAVLQSAHSDLVKLIGELDAHILEIKTKLADIRRRSTAKDDEFEDLNLDMSDLQERISAITDGIHRSTSNVVLDPHLGGGDSDEQSLKKAKVPSEHQKQLQEHNERLQEQWLAMWETQRQIIEAQAYLDEQADLGERRLAEVGAERTKQSDQLAGIEAQLKTSLAELAKLRMTLDTLLKRYEMV